ncbi:hypothetical protein Lesp02_49500 [Lentzea sp. NBRC 105346]|uniref:SRPBCC family protein n=1 Tax=Lentzea sp. NBRC 105346 TaxID=3032205 RepID=UPI0024A60719|nr:SRPBCC family protein [Lentzea sp. NBRC 105346]GLZ32762.1 hypothetical protein Lesp02_49500 [Lentzea sp. NBRC 105346]
MKLEHRFSVPAPVDEVWEALLDPERVAPCMPGATLASVEGKAFSGSVKVKLGPVQLLYRGTGEFVEIDPATHSLVLRASGKDTHGNGTASATVTVHVDQEVLVETDLSITGRPAQLGRGLIAEVGGRIVGQFAESLARELEPGEADEVQQQHLRVVRDEPEPIDLIGTAGVPVLKRLLPVLAIALIAIFVVLRRRRHR